MIDFKNGKLGADFAALRSNNPVMYAVLVTAADFVWREYKQHTFVTSIYRPADRESVHAHWRGVDVRIYNEARRGTSREHEMGWTEAAVEETLCFLADTFDYGGGHSVAIAHGEGLHRHVHLQAPAIARWGGAADSAPLTAQEALSYAEEVAAYLQDVHGLNRTEALHTALYAAEKAKERL